MVNEPLYYRTIREHEDTFRAILTDIKNNERFPNFPSDLDPNAPLEEILSKYHPNNPPMIKDPFTLGFFFVGPNDFLHKLEEGEIVLELNYSPKALCGQGMGYKYNMNHGVPEYVGSRHTTKF